MYDLVIAGGGTAGCAAAYIAGMAGLKVLLLEKDITLGGTITQGLVIPMMKTSKNQINNDFFDALISEMKNLNGQITYQNNPGWINHELCKIALDNLMLKSNVEVRFSTQICAIGAENSHIKAIYINRQNLSVYTATIGIQDEILFEPIATRYILDATGNCEVGKLLNCNFLNDNLEFQPMSLRFVMGGINTDEFTKWIMTLDSDRDVTTSERIDGKNYCSTAYTWDKQWALKPFFDDAVTKNILKDSDRNYFQVFSIPNMPDCMAFNCPRIVESLNPSNTKDITQAVKEARQAIYRLSNFCRTYLKGFENSYISHISDYLGIRVSNRIKGKYIYTQEDIISGKKFDNPVVISDYPIDVHSKDKNASILRKTAEYQLPIESLMSADYDNLFIAGRCISADYNAQGALRIQPSCFSMGEGIAKYIVKNV